MSRVIHVSLDIRGALNWENKDLRGMFKHEDGRPMSAREVKRVLIDQIAAGRKFLPVGPACDNFDYQSGCPGHQETKSAEEKQP